MGCRTDTLAIFAAVLQDELENIYWRAEAPRLAELGLDAPGPR